MADFTQIIQEINDDINTNGVGAITGAKLNEVLRDMIAAVNAEKQDPLTIDAAPTEDSNNPVQSGGVYDELEDKADKVSGATQGNLAGLDSYGNLTDSGIAASEVATTSDLAGKQDTISDLATIRSGAAAGATAYQKPSTGIPKTELASGVQTSLGKADTAVQQVTVGTTTTGNAGTNASVTNSGTATNPVLNFTIPRGADGADAVNPFKGWLNSLEELKAAHTAIVGDSAYVKDASPATTWSIYVYDSTASSDNYWADSGTNADTSNVQTFASGEEVNEVGIVNIVDKNATNNFLITAFAGYNSFPSNKNEELIGNSGDLYISDEDGFVIAKFSNGNFEVKNFKSNILENKRVSFLGDSITTFSNYPGSNHPFYTGSNAGVTSVNDTWWKSFCDKQNAVVNRIYAYGGGDVVNNLCTHYNDLHSSGTSGTQPDVIIILAGINDWYHGKTLGSIGDSENTNSTFYAAYKFLLKNLITTYPNAQIIGLTMMNSMIRGTTIPLLNENNNSIRDFCKAIVDCCNYYSVTCLDLNKLVNINGSNYSQKLADYTHPNIVGIKDMVGALQNNIHKLVTF